MSSPRARTVLRRLAVVPLAVTLLSFVGLAPAAAHPGPTSGAASYVALGDSYASGEGLPPYVAGTESDNGCHRSQGQSYPVLLAESGRRPFSSLTSVACSGAVTADLLATTPNTSQPPQVSALGAGTRTVTVTIGGNDAGFGAVITDCVYSPDPTLQQALKGSPDCRDRDDVAVRTRIAALGGGRGAPTVPGVVPLPDLLERIQAAAPRATIYLTGYPRLLGRELTDAAGCRVSDVAPLYISGADARWIRTKAGELNATIAGSARRARARGLDVRYVDVARVFRDHNVCDRKSPWVNGVVLTPTDPSQPPQLSPATFHPTARGQRAYAAAVLDAVPSWRAHPLPRA
ncbi:MAG TPA: SGNH/GDSL hydrolase family protein [Microlunatus sp.]|nr:SGNH/GDSL hydrolase family protein [Microlunatus sp.]